MQNFTVSEKQTFISNFYDGKPKNEQDTYLMGLMEAVAVSRHRKRDGSKGEKTSTFKYHVVKEGIRVQVCKEAFLNLHCISNARVQRLNKLLVAGSTPKDLRGKHGTRPRAIDSEYLDMIKEHIRSFPYKTSHYSSKSVHYLNPGLTVRTMHSLFIKKYPELKEKIKYEFYLKYFNENCNLKFGRPQVDVCGDCESLGVKLKNQHLNDNAKRAAAAELMVHRRRAKKFYTKLQEVQKLCAERPDVGGISFDYMQNLPLPHIPVQEIFYYRQLWVYSFEVHNLKDNSGHFYLYSEGQARKGPDEVCTFLKDYIENKIDPAVTELHVFSDGCPGQNRNNTVVRFFLALAATNRFKTIHQYFPMRGHSYLPCDRDFGCAKRIIRKSERIYIPEEYQQMIEQSRNNIPFGVTSITYQSILDFKSWWSQYYKSTSQSVNKKNPVKFMITQYKQFTYQSDTPGYVTVHQYIDGLVTETFKLQKPNVNPTFPTKQAYKEPVPINSKKIADLKKVLQYISGEELEFYYHVTSGPTTEIQDAAD